MVLSVWQAEVRDLQYCPAATEAAKALSLRLDDDATTHEMSVEKQSHFVRNSSSLQFRQGPLHIGESADEGGAVLRIFVDGLSQRSLRQRHDTGDCGFHVSSFVGIGPFETPVANEAAAMTIDGEPSGCIARSNEAIRQAVSIWWDGHLGADW